MTDLIQENSFQGGVFHSSLEHGRAGAQIALGHDGVTASTSDGGQYNVSYRVCKIQIGGASGRMVFCRDQANELTIFCEDKKFLEQLRVAGGHLMADQLDEVKQSQKQSRRRRLVWTFGLIALLSLGAIGIWWGLAAGAKILIANIPISVDEKIGKMARDAMTMDGPRIRDAVVVDAVDTMVRRLADHASRTDVTYEVWVVDAPIVNAFALPGGYIVVYTGLIDRAETPEQLAGVIAHEMAHVTGRHGLQRVAQSAGVIIVVDLMLGDITGLIALGVELMKHAAQSQYSRDQETEADIEGVRMLDAANIDPAGLVQFFEMLEKDKEMITLPIAWMSSHPQHADRVASIQQQIATLGERKYTPLSVDWAAVQAHVDAGITVKAKEQDQESTSQKADDHASGNF